MPVELKANKGPESITQATLLRWYKPDGSAVKQGEAVCEMESEKATEEVFAPVSGVLSIKIQPGTRVDIEKDVIGTIDPTGSPTATPPEPARPAPSNNATPQPPTAATSVSDARVSPAAAVHAETRGVDVNKIKPTGRVITKGDVLAMLEPSPQPTPAVMPRPTVELPAPVTSGVRESRQKMTPIRQRIAERLLAAQQNAAILTTFNEADLSAIMALRTKYKETFQKKHGVGLGFMGFFVKASVEALKAFPTVNARIDGSDIVYQHFYDLGVAVSTEKGLMVPVLRGCDSRSFASVEKGIAELAVKARDGRIAVSDMQGGTFTITNGGVFGSMLSTPILNPPQSAILGMHAIQKRAVVVDDQIVIRPMMYLALSYDHRIIDGREAVSFLVRIKECLEAPERLLLEI
jgi:2-oxoglutarate dehydrogenase E2 component (dihydrolipoamide succinyltransferase)